MSDLAAFKLIDRRYGLLGYESREDAMQHITIG